MAKLLPTVYLGDGMNSPSEDFQVQLERGTFPPIFSLPLFELSDLHRSLESGGDITSIRFQVCNLSIPTIAPPHVTLRMKADPFAIAYCIAKWAYAFAAAKRVTERCDTSGIRSMLLGTADDVKNYVGGAIFQERVRRGHLHRLELRQRGRWQTVVLSLFASAGMSPYEVVIGQIR